MENKKYILSIGIPTYNRIGYLKDSLNSILNSKSNYQVEIVVSDNCSDDGTQEFMNSLITQNDNIKYLRNDSNKGFDFNFYQCVRNCSGDYILVLSDDDILSSNFINIIINKIINDNPDFICLQSKGFDLSKTNISESDNKALCFSQKSDLFFNDKNKFIKFVSYNFTFVSSFIMKKDMVNDLFSNELFFNSINHTWFINTAFFLHNVMMGCRFYYYAHPFINARQKNFAHYNFYDVFLNKFKYTLKYCMNEFQINSRSIRFIYSDMLKKHTRRFELDIKLGRIKTFQTKPKYKYLLKAIFYPNAWIYVYPISLCPKWLLKIIHKLFSSSHSWS